jgi:integrase
MLVRLGLRAGEVAKLQLEHIDWRGGEIVIAHSKGNRSERLPLPADVGEAIAAYLRHGRPASAQGRMVFARIKAALLSTLLGVGAELGSGSDAGNGNSAILQALRRGAGDSLNQTGQQVVRRNLNIQPTLTIRPGFPVRVIVNRDLVLEPYRG